MDHITMHLKAEAQNNVEFRALVGDARMGKVGNGIIDKDSLNETEMFIL